jgi:glycosyltransferase involved in cell wall biosynthesis
MILLSILIPTIPERNERFTKLYNELMRQKTAFETAHPSIGRAEVLVNADKRFLDGGLSIGKKRQALVKSAEGKYLCFIDDDETISPQYLESLMRLCAKGADVCTFRCIVKMETFWTLIDMRFDYKCNDQLNPNYTVRRPPWHICPVKSEYAKKFPFPDLNNAEDFVWMEKVLTYCTTESHTDEILFQYNHKEQSEADKIPLP